MSQYSVTGWLQHEVVERKEEWLEENPNGTFEENYCLAKIPKQPDSYDGPPRFCMKKHVKEIGDSGSYACKNHGGYGDTNADALDGNRNVEQLHIKNMKHGMHATVEHLKDDFDEKDEALYEWIVMEFPEQYDIDLEDDPILRYDLHRLAAEIVRAERGRGFIVSEGEVDEKEVRDDEGRIMTDPQTGEVVTQKSEHYLSEMLARQDRKITKLEKELGITRKEQRRHDNENNAIEAMKGFQEVGKAIVSRDDNEYDPDDQPWESDDESESSK